MDTATEKLLWDRGWQIDCYSPLELSNPEAESVASGEAAEMVIDMLRAEKDVQAEHEIVRLRVYQEPENEKAVRRHYHKAFIDDVWFLVRQLRDKIAEASARGYCDESVVLALKSAQSRLAGALGHLESVDKEEFGMAMDLNEEERQLVLKHRKEQTKKKAKDWQPKQASQYTDAEKIEEFNKLHNMALNMWMEYQKSYCEDNDDDHWCYEAVLELLGPGVWEAIRAIQAIQA